MGLIILVVLLPRARLLESCAQGAAECSFREAVSGANGSVEPATYVHRAELVHGVIERVGSIINHVFCFAREPCFGVAHDMSHCFAHAKPCTRREWTTHSPVNDHSRHGVLTVYTVAPIVIVYPTIADVTRELIKLFKAELGAGVHVAWFEQRPIEAVSSTGEVIVQTQDKPGVALYGPTNMPFGTTIHKPKGYKTIVSIDRQALTYQDSPFPMLYHPQYDVVGWGIHPQSFVAGQTGVLDLLHAVTVILQGSRIKGDDWIGEEEDWPGYYVEHVDVPRMTHSGGKGALLSFSGSLRVMNVRIASEQAIGEGNLVGHVNIETGIGDGTEPPQD